eukprot:5260591-Prymnesium_polylepis.2
MAARSAALRKNWAGDVMVRVQSSTDTQAAYERLAAFRGLEQLEGRCRDRSASEGEHPRRNLPPLALPSPRPPRLVAFRVVGKLFLPRQL